MRERLWRSLGWPRSAERQWFAVWAKGRDYAIISGLPNQLGNDPSEYARTIAFFDGSHKVKQWAHNMQDD